MRIPKFCRLFKTGKIRWYLLSSFIVFAHNVYAHHVPCLVRYDTLGRIISHSI
jgi:hypothetical protein